MPRFQNVGYPFFPEHYLKVQHGYLYERTCGATNEVRNGAIRFRGVFWSLNDSNKTKESFLFLSGWVRPFDSLLSHLAHKILEFWDNI